ncbi:hypothetical protein B0H19DRAFT_1249493 [Mycena capillaripes]|nr:hypothetical protein B0H19DRAFT_1249493 [Mycena capillaripes]
MVHPGGLLGRQKYAGCTKKLKAWPKTTLKRIPKYWFETEDIFLLDWLIIPWFWSWHWMVVGIDVNKKGIYVYDSYKER